MLNRNRHIVLLLLVVIGGFVAWYLAAKSKSRSDLSQVNFPPNKDRLEKKQTARFVGNQKAFGGIGKMRPPKIVEKNKSPYRPFAYEAMVKEVETMNVIYERERRDPVWSYKLETVMKENIKKKLRKGRSS